MKLEKKQVDIKDKVIELVAKSKKNDENLAKISVTLNQFAKVSAFQKEEILSLKEEIKKESLNTLNIVKKLINEIEKQPSSAVAAANTNFFDDKDLDFLVSKIKEKLSTKKESKIKEFFNKLKEKFELLDYVVITISIILVITVYFNFDKIKLMIFYLKKSVVG